MGVWWGGEWRGVDGGEGGVGGFVYAVGVYG